MPPGRGTTTAGAGKPAPPSRSIKEDKAKVAEQIRARLIAATKDDQIIRGNPLDIDPRIQVVSSGFMSLDSALGVGGFTKGRIHAFEGPPDAGKTALVGAIIGAYQRADPSSIHAFLAVEPHGADEHFLRTCGVNTDPTRFIIAYPESAEAAFVACMTLMGYKEDKNRWVHDPKLMTVDSITWDSWGGSPVDTIGMAPLARVGSEIWATLASKANRTKTTFFVTNHIHEKPGVSFGDPRYSKGGESFKYNQTTKIWIVASHITKDEVTKRKISHDLRVDIVRNKVAAVGPVVFLHFNYRSGFDPLVDAYSFLKERGITFKHKEKPDGNTFIFAFAQDTEGEPFYSIPQDTDISQKSRSDEICAVGEKAFLDEIRGYPDAQEAFLAYAKSLSGA